MRPILFVALLFPVAFGQAFAETPPATMPLGVTPLFNTADDFEKWDGDPKRWKVDDNMIVGSNPADDPLPEHTYLIYRGDADKNATFDNFELTAQFKIEGAGGNSGIQYRGKVVDADKWKVAGYQADIDFDNRYAGILYEQDGRGILAQRGQSVTIKADGNKDEKTYAKSEQLGMGIHAGQWNDYRILADGNTLEHYINGELTVRVVDHQTEAAAKSGIIALQLHKGPPMTVRYKNIAIRSF